MAESGEHAVQFKFDAVHTKRFVVFEHAPNVDPDDLAFLYTVGIDVGPTRSKATVTVRVEVVTDDTEEVLVEMATTTVFAIRGLPGSDTGGPVPLPRDLMRTLTSLAVSTTRGILVERTANTDFGAVILPPFDPVSFFQANDATEAPSTSALT